MSHTERAQVIREVAEAIAREFPKIELVDQIRQLLADLAAREDYLAHRTAPVLPGE